MEDVKKLQQERTRLWDDLYSYKIPKRLPIDNSLPHTLIAEFGGLNLIDVQYGNYESLLEPANKICDMIFSDTPPVRGSGRYPKFYQLLKSRNFVMGATGYVQHPEVRGMEADEYDELIADPYAFCLEKAIPRHQHAINLDEPVKTAYAVAMSIAANAQDAQAMGGIIRSVVERKGYYPGAPRGSGGFTVAPYDFIGDQLRGFSEISKDVRRRRNAIKDACEAIYPLMFKYGLPEKPHLSGNVSVPLHMPPFMNEKDVAELWMPTFKKLCEEYAAMGVRINAFCENDWQRFCGLISDELPAGLTLRFEYGDPKVFKEKLGKKFIIGGLYPVNTIRTGTKQQCIDKTKELIDILAPGGGYLFGYDKVISSTADMNWENFAAISETVRDYGVYDNAGENYGTPLNTEGFKCDPVKSARFDSKYIFDWDSVKGEYPLIPGFAEKQFFSLDDMMFKYFIRLLV